MLTKTLRCHSDVQDLQAEELQVFIWASDEGSKSPSMRTVEHRSPLRRYAHTLAFIVGGGRIHWGHGGRGLPAEVGEQNPDLSNVG